MADRGLSSKKDVETADLKPSHIEDASQAVEIGPFRVVGLGADEVDFYSNFPEESRKRVFRKVDVRLVPMLAVLYLICHIDRANIGNAKIEGMIEDLNMTGVQYNTVLSIFFVPYVLLEVPSNILLKKFKRPSTYLGILVLSWGIVMTCTGLVKNFGGLMAVRVLLGIFEAGFFPGAIYLCSYWYMPKDLALRISYFYCASALSGAFSGLLAAAIARMDGVGGVEGWRWIFILEGLATVAIGVACFFMLIDTPALSKRTKFTLPTITKAMGFSATNAQLTSAPPYVAAAVSAIVFAKISDRFFWRMPFVAIPMIIVVVAYAVIVSLKGALEANRGVAYFAVVLAVVGIYPIQAAAASWNANNIAPASRRAIGIALMNCVGNTGGILGSFMYLEKESPKYYTGFGISLALGGTGFFMALLLEWTYKVANAKKAELVDEARTRYTEEELFDMGDRSPLFKLVL
ncbi:hypothetical protein HFD88_010658 [Aspergillus terreus]|nr:hypothetical protein HFD88_010658 [Aspergillus terreus]